jgi:hypothetical protein
VVNQKANTTNSTMLVKANRRAREEVLTALNGAIMAVAGFITSTSVNRGSAALRDFVD